MSEAKQNFIQTVFLFLKGKKTYIVAALMIILGWLTDNNQMILEGFGFIALRKGVKDLATK